MWSSSVLRSEAANFEERGETERLDCRGVRGGGLQLSTHGVLELQDLHYCLQYCCPPFPGSGGIFLFRNRFVCPLTAPGRVSILGWLEQRDGAEV